MNSTFEERYGRKHWILFKLSWRKLAVGAKIRFSKTGTILGKAATDHRLARSLFQRYRLIPRSDHLKRNYQDDKKDQWYYNSLELFTQRSVSLTIYATDVRSTCERVVLRSTATSAQKARPPFFSRRGRLPLQWGQVAGAPLQQHLSHFSLTSAMLAPRTAP